MVFFAGASIFPRPAASLFNAMPKSVALDYSIVYAPRAMVFRRDQEHLEAAPVHVQPACLDSIGTGNVVYHPHILPFSSLPRPLAPHRSHVPPVAVVSALRRELESPQEAVSNSEVEAPLDFNADDSSDHSSNAALGPDFDDDAFGPPAYLINAVDNLNAALRYSAGIANIRPDRGSRLLGLEIVEPSLSVPQFRALREEILAAPLWHRNGPRLVRARQPVRRMALKVDLTDDGDYGVVLESTVDYRGARSEMFLDFSAALDRDGYVEIAPDSSSSG